MILINDLESIIRYLASVILTDDTLLLQAKTIFRYTKYYSGRTAAEHWFLRKTWRQIAPREHINFCLHSNDILKINRCKFYLSKNEHMSLNIKQPDSYIDNHYNSRILLYIFPLLPCIWCYFVKQRNISTYTLHTYMLHKKTRIIGNVPPSSGCRKIL